MSGRPRKGVQTKGRNSCLKQENSWKKKDQRQDALFDQRKKEMKRIQEKEDRAKEVALQAKLKAKEDARNLQRELGMANEKEEEEEGEDQYEKGRLYYESLFANNVMCVTYKGARVFKSPELMEIYYKRKMTSQEIENNRNLRRELRDSCINRLDEYMQDKSAVVAKSRGLEEEQEEKEEEGGEEVEEVERLANGGSGPVKDVDKEIASIFQMEKLSIAEPSLQPMIREAKDEDYEEMISLDREIFDESQVWDPDLLRGMMKSKTTRVLVLTTSEGERSIMGFVIFDKVGKIMKLGVRLCDRRKGYGSRLLDEALQVLKRECQGRYVSPTLHVDPSNKKAIELYKAKGFAVDARVKDYYKTGEDALRMMLC